jgi:hypothetical protein
VSIPWNFIWQTIAGLTQWHRFIVAPQAAGARFRATTQDVVYWTPMREILEIEEHVAIPPMMYSDPFYRITYLIKEEIRKYKWIEAEKGRKLSWEQARKEWTDAYEEKYEKFLIDTLYFPDENSDKERSAPSKSSPWTASWWSGELALLPSFSEFIGVSLYSPSGSQRKSSNKERVVSQIAAAAFKMWMPFPKRKANLPPFMKTLKNSDNLSRTAKCSRVLQPWPKFEAILVA